MPEMIGAPRENTVQHGVLVISKKCVWDGVLFIPLESRSSEGKNHDR